MTYKRHELRDHRWRTESLRSEIDAAMRTFVTVLETLDPGLAHLVSWQRDAVKP